MTDNPAYPDWKVQTQYRTGDQVTHGSFYYKALKDNIGVHPESDPATWQQVGTKPNA